MRAHTPRPVAVLDIIHACMYLTWVLPAAQVFSAALGECSSRLRILRLDLPALTESVRRRRRILKNRVRPDAISMASFHAPCLELIARGRLRICAKRFARHFIEWPSAIAGKHSRRCSVRAAIFISRRGGEEGPSLQSGDHRIAAKLTPGARSNYCRAQPAFAKPEHISSRGGSANRPGFLRIQI